MRTPTTFAKAKHLCSKKGSKRCNGRYKQIDLGRERRARSEEIRSGTGGIAFRQPNEALVLSIACLSLQKYQSEMIKFNFLEGSSDGEVAAMIEEIRKSQILITQLLLTRMCEERTLATSLPHVIALGEYYMPQDYADVVNLPQVKVKNDDNARGYQVWEAKWIKRDVLHENGMQEGMLFLVHTSINAQWSLQTNLSGMPYLTITNKSCEATTFVGYLHIRNAIARENQFTAASHIFQKISQIPLSEDNQRLYIIGDFNRKRTKNFTKILQGKLNTLNRDLVIINPELGDHNVGVIEVCKQKYIDEGSRRPKAVEVHSEVTHNATHGYFCET